MTKYTNLNRFGRDAQDGSITGKTNIGIFGKTGSGKTEMLKEIAVEDTSTFRIVIDPLNNFTELKRKTKNFN